MNDFQIWLEHRTNKSSCHAQKLEKVVSTKKPTLNLRQRSVFGSLLSQHPFEITYMQMWDFSQLQQDGILIVVYVRGM